MGKPKMPVRTDEPAAVWVDRSALHAWAENPRKNDGDPVKKVMESIKRFGFAAPIVARNLRGAYDARHLLGAGDLLRLACAVRSARRTFANYINLPEELTR